MGRSGCWRFWGSGCELPERKKLRKTIIPVLFLNIFISTKSFKKMLITKCFWRLFSPTNIKYLFVVRVAPSTSRC